jgi:hypothetical protein
MAFILFTASYLAILTAGNVCGGLVDFDAVCYGYWITFL